MPSAGRHGRAPAGRRRAGRLHNANSRLTKQISDIQDMLAQGPQFLIVAPLNSDGLEPALQAAAAKKVPVLTIDRKINATACKDYLPLHGSKFVEQGKRAADALIQATGGWGKVAILLGSSANNVTTPRHPGHHQPDRYADLRRPVRRLRSVPGRRGGRADVPVPRPHSAVT